MSTEEFGYLLQALIYVFLQPFYWWLAIGVAAAFCFAVLWFLLSLYVWLVR